MQKKRRALIFIANGLGMAIDHIQYDIKIGIRYGIEKLEEKEKKCIEEFLSCPATTKLETLLENEQSNDLAYLNMISMVTGMIKKTSGDKKNALISDSLILLSDSINKFIFYVAKSFNKSEDGQCDKYNLFADFANNLAKYIYNNGAHVVTTNYDDLLYRYFLKTDIKLDNGNKIKIMQGRRDRTYLADGFGQELNRDKLNKMKLNIYDSYPNVGWYLHLHGSSRFYSKYGSGIVNKKDFGDYDEAYVPHVILNHFDLKKFQINVNPLLNRYFCIFKEVLKTTDVLYILGYSGSDSHINDAIKEDMNKKGKIIIINREADKERMNKKFWEDKLKLLNFELIYPQSILDFNDW